MLLILLLKSQEAGIFSELKAYINKHTKIPISFTLGYQK